MRRVAFQLARHEIPHDDPARLAVDEDQVEHLAVRKHPDRAELHLPHHRLVRAEQELLARLAAGVEGP